MSAIRITDLPILSGLQDHDKVNFQRLVDGVWTDFFTEGSVLQGEIRTFIQPVDLSDTNSAIVYTPGSGELVVPIAMWMTYTPDESPSGIEFSVEVFSGSSFPLTFTVLVIDGVPGVFNAVDSGQYIDLDQPLNLAWTSSGANGTGMIFVQYVVLGTI